MTHTKMTALLTVGAGLTLAATAFGGNNDLGVNASRTQISLGDLREHCSEILANPQMVKPQVDVVCDQTQIVWREAPSAFNLADSQSNRATIGMKGWMAYMPSQNAPSLNQHACSVFQKHQLYVRPVSQAMRCEELLSTFKTEADLSGYCTNLIAQRMAQDSSLQTDTPLTDTFTTCNSEYGTAVKGDQTQQQPAKAPANQTPPAQKGDNQSPPAQQTTDKSSQQGGSQSSQQGGVESLRRADRSGNWSYDSDT